MFKSKWILHFWQAVLLAVIFVAWWALTKPGLIPPFIFENDTQAAFFSGGNLPPHLGLVLCEP